MYFYVCTEYILLGFDLLKDKMHSLGGQGYRKCTGQSTKNQEIKFSKYLIHSFFTLHIPLMLLSERGDTKERTRGGGSELGMCDAFVLFMPTMTKDKQMNLYLCRAT